MIFTSRTLQIGDLSFASKLDHQWFGEYGVSEEQLSDFISKHPSESIALLSDNKFEGFSTFEVLKEGSKPGGYIGDILSVSKVLFLQQFTTTTNYSKLNIRMDQELLNAVEQKAKELNCNEIWEALATTHPYSEPVNPEYDAFGFYTQNGYTFDKQKLLTWQPDPSVSIPCYLFRKEL